MSFDYDSLNRLDSMSWLFFGRDNISYDAVSRVNIASLNLPNNAGTTFNLNYNEASQVLNISNSNGTYDWPAPTNFSRTYGLNGLNQVTSSNAYTFSYDAKGNLTSDGVNSYSYDVLNRLTAGPNGVSLSYDALGRLASTTNSSGTTTQYLYDGQNLVATYDGSGNVTSHYVFGQGTDQPVMWYNGSGTSDRRFLMANPQGSIVGVSDVNGNLLSANTYDEFGVPGTSNLGAFQYTGQLWLSDAGLYYYKARIYSPTLGRFLQTDPIGYGDGPNWYNYAHGDPVNISDPSGTDGDMPTVTPVGVAPNGESAFLSSAIDVTLPSSSGSIGSGGSGGILGLPKFIFSQDLLLQNNQPPCNGGAARQYGISYSGNLFGILGGASLSVTVGVSIPSGGAGAQGFIGGEFDPMVGLGVNAGTSIGPTWGHSPTAVETGFNPTGSHVEGGAGLAYGASIGQTVLPDGTVSTSVGLAGPPLPALKAGAYVGGGPAFSGQLATPQLGCHR